MIHYLCAHVHGHKSMDYWLLFRINKPWTTVGKRRSRGNFLDYTLSDANFQIPWNLILWSPHNEYLKFGDPPEKRVLEFSDPPPPVVNGHSLIKRDNLCVTGPKLCLNFILRWSVLCIGRLFWELMGIPLRYPFSVSVYKKCRPIP